MKLDVPSAWAAGPTRATWCTAPQEGASGVIKDHAGGRIAEMHPVKVVCTWFAVVSRQDAEVHGGMHGVVGLSCAANLTGTDRLACLGVCRGARAIEAVGIDAVAYEDIGVDARPVHVKGRGRCGRLDRGAMVEVVQVAPIRYRRRTRRRTVLTTTPYREVRLHTVGTPCWGKDPPATGQEVAGNTAKPSLYWGSSSAKY